MLRTWLSGTLARETYGDSAAHACKVTTPGAITAWEVSPAPGRYGFASIHAIVAGAAVVVSIQAMGGRSVPGVEVLIGLAQDIASAYAGPGMVPKATG